MKYTIEGFSQEGAIKAGLDIKDLIFLRWMLDFYNTGCMEIHIFAGRQYVWIDYSYVIRELPILGIQSKDVLARRIRHIEQCGIFEFMCFAGAGNKTYFRFIEKALFALLSDTNRQGQLFDRVGGGSYPKVGRVPTQKSEGFLPKSRDQYDSSINDSSINDNSQPGKKASPAASTSKPVEGPQKHYSPEFTAKAAAAKARGFNIFQLTNRFYNVSKLINPLPEQVLSEVLDKYLNNSQVRDVWPYFLRVLEEKSREYFASRSVEEAKRYKQDPASIGAILAKLGLKS